MDRNALYCLLFGFLIASGCGRSQVAQSTPESAVDAAAQQTAPSLQPVDVVSQFLDEVRRGGEDSRANDLLTTKAQAELKSIGRSIEPIGSPDARFIVTRAEGVPGEQGSALVHSIWSEPSAEGGSREIQVVWAVEEEPAGWRISGMAMELDPKLEPVIIDFENAQMLAKVLAETDASQDAPAPSAAQVPSNPTISR